ncbi:hypothetical protein OG571_47605 (plasmid) [Streptomyces sp. NBC_01369]
MLEPRQQRTVELSKPAYTNLFREPIFEPAAEADQGVDERPRDEDEAC